MDSSAELKKPTRPRVFGNERIAKNRWENVEQTSRNTGKDYRKRRMKIKRKITANLSIEE